MPYRHPISILIAGCGAALALIGALSFPGGACALPGGSEDASPAPKLGSVTSSVASQTVTFEPGTPAIPTDGTFRYTVKIRLTRPADSVTVRLKINNPSGKLMIQQTRIANDAETGTVITSFERPMADLNLDPGSYPAVFVVRVSQDGVVTEKTVDTDLLLFDRTRARLPITFAIRVNGQPLADPQGRFIADPARYTQARDDANRIAAWIVTDSRARVALSVSPLLLTEWARISQGYELAGPEGVIAVTADSPTSKAYAATLSLLRQAVGTGRLELLRAGYSDPDLSALAANKMIQDVDEQYAKGISAIFSSVETTPSTGTVPAGGCLPPAAGSMLARNGVGYAVVTQECAQVKGAPASPGLYLLDGPGLNILVADNQLSAAVANGDLNKQISTSLTRATGSTAQSPLVVTCDMGAGGVGSDTLIEAASALADLPWLSVRLPREAAGEVSREKVTLLEGEPKTKAPAGYWSEVRLARAWARAISACTDDQNRDARTAEDDSLIAQCSAWSGPSGDWALADRGRAYASTALRQARSVLSNITLRVESMTLPGTSGQVPIIVVNAGDVPLSVDIDISTSRGITIDGDRSLRVDLSPKDNFVEVDIGLAEVLSGDFAVTVSSAGVVLARKTIKVRASYLDRLAMVGGVVGLLGLMLVFIIRRVRAAERSNGNDLDSAG